MAHSAFVRSNTRLRLASVFAALLVLCAAAMPVAARKPDTRPDRPDKIRSDGGLGNEDRGRIADAIASGKKTVTLLIAAEPGRLDEAAATLESLGGVVRIEDSAVGYLKVDVPTAKAEQAAAIDAIAAVDVDGLIPLDDPRPEGAQNPAPQTPPGAATPRNNPYLPIADTGAAQFTVTNPTWDGRGAVIAVLDSGVDLDHPALATTTTGAPKIIDWYNANATNSGDGTWVATTGRFTRHLHCQRRDVDGARNGWPVRVRTAPGEPARSGGWRDWRRPRP